MRVGAAAIATGDRVGGVPAARSCPTGGGDADCPFLEKRWPPRSEADRFSPSLVARLV